MKKLTITGNVAKDAELWYDTKENKKEGENHLLQGVSSQVTTLVS